MAVRVDLLVVHYAAMSFGIQMHSANRECRVAALGFPRSPQNGLDAQDHFSWAERLRNVVVGAELQTDDAIDLFAFGRKHDHGQGSCRALAAEIAQDVEAVDSGQHQVENHQGRLLRANGRQRQIAAADHADLEPLLSKVVVEHLRDAALVLHHEQVFAHPRDASRARRWS